MYSVELTDKSGRMYNYDFETYKIAKSQFDIFIAQDSCFRCVVLYKGFPNLIDQYLWT